MELNLTAVELATLKKYETMRVSYEEAVEIAIKEITDSTPDMGMKQFTEVGIPEDVAQILIDNMVKGAAKKIQLVAAFGVEAFIEAGKTVSTMPEADVFNAIDLLEQELLKPYK